MILELQKTPRLVKILITTFITTVLFIGIYYMVNIYNLNLREIFNLMFLSKLFIPITKDLPSEAKNQVPSVNAKIWNDQTVVCWNIFMATSRI